MNTTKIEYIWIGGNKELRSKTKILFTNNNNNSSFYKHIIHINDLPSWNYDGSSTNQASSCDSEIIIKPRKIYKDPFNGSIHLLVLCDTWLPSGEPHSTNTRIIAENIFSNNGELEPWFGLEQEFFVFDINTNLPIGFPFGGLQKNKCKYYCSIGTGKAIGRDFFEEVEQNCLYAGIKLSGKNFEVCPGQMEFQVMNSGINAADDIILLRYILSRTAEKYNYIINLDAKPLKGDWNGSGMHTNFSTNIMRENNGYSVILDAINKLKIKHEEHMDVYGDDNKDRLTGTHETSNINSFTYGVGSRETSIRIPRETEKNNCGYFEDRRPSSSSDPYLVTSKIFETCCIK